MALKFNKDYKDHMALPSSVASIDTTDAQLAENRHEEMKSQTRKWRVFPGRNKFYCDGRIIMARQTGILYFTLCLIVITVALFFIFECRLTLVSSLKCGFLIPIVAAILFLFSISCLLRTAWSDPGIIPRSTPSEAMYLEKSLQAQQASEAAAAGQQGYRPPPRTLEIVLDGVPTKLKYCFTCKIFRPPRASHCSLCDNCVDCFDHHCPWVGNCVGRRNYRFFYLFVTSLSVLCVYIFAFSIVHMVLLTNEKENFLEALKISPGSVLEILICFFSVWSVFGLSGFHSYLIANGITTNEDIKGTWSRKRNKNTHNPFDNGGCFRNFRYVLCGPMPASAIDRRGFVRTDSDAEEGMDETPGPTAGTTNGVLNSNQNMMHGTAMNEHYDVTGASYPRQPQYPGRVDVNTQGGTSEPQNLNQLASHQLVSHHPTLQYNSNNSAIGPKPCYTCESQTVPIINDDDTDSQPSVQIGHITIGKQEDDNEIILSEKTLLGAANIENGDLVNASISSGSSKTSTV